MHFHNSVLHYLYTMADGFVIYGKARTFKAKGTNARPRAGQSQVQVKAKAKKFDLKAKAKD